MRDELRKVIRDAFLEGRDDEAIAIIKSHEYSKSYSPIHIIGLNSNSPIPSLSTAQIVSRPQRNPFKPHRFAIDSNTSYYFDILDIRVGNQSIFLTSSEIAGEFFKVKFDSTLEVILNGEIKLISITDEAEDSFGRMIDCPTCQVSQDLVVMILNKGAIPLKFQSAFLGHEVISKRQF